MISSTYSRSAPRNRFFGSMLGSTERGGTVLKWTDQRSIRKIRWSSEIADTISLRLAYRNRHHSLFSNMQNTYSQKNDDPKAFSHDKRTQTCLQAVSVFLSFFRFSFKCPIPERREERQKDTEKHRTARKIRTCTREIPPAAANPAGT